MHLMQFQSTSAEENSDVQALIFLCLSSCYFHRRMDKLFIYLFIIIIIIKQSMDD